LRGYLWLITGVVAGAACWAAPLIQQFTARRGNLSNLLGGDGRVQHPAGLGFGLKALAAAVEPPAYWWRPQRSLGDLSMVGQRSALAGLVVLGIVAAVLAVALVVLRSRRAAALAGLSLLLGLAVIGTFANVPASSLAGQTNKLGNLRYLLTPLFPAGVLAWAAAVVVLVLLAGRVAARRRSHAGQAADRTGAAAMTQRLTAVAPAALAVILALACVLTVVRVNRILRPEGTVMKDVSRASSLISGDLPSQRIALSVVAPTNSYRRQMTFGLVYALRTAGYQAQTGSNWGVQFGQQYIYRHEPVPLVTVHVRGSAISVDVSRHAPIVTIKKGVFVRTYP
jgi:hypothetical protein